MTFDTFFKEVSEKNIQFAFNETPNERSGLLSNEALFHLPLLASIILMLSKGRVKPEMAQIGQIVGECMEVVFLSFKGSSQHVGWSGNLRIRTVRALTFLEAAKLVHINPRNKQITSTDFGNKVINQALNGDTDLSYTLREVERNYRNICKERQIELELI